MEESDDESKAKKGKQILDDQIKLNKFLTKIFVLNSGAESQPVSKSDLYKFNSSDSSSSEDVMVERGTPGDIRYF